MNSAENLMSSLPGLAGLTCPQERFLGQDALNELINARKPGVGKVTLTKVPHAYELAKIEGKRGARAAGYSP
ncbi:MAG: hypothetical protein BWY66_00899 [bacterium ADurb.Bin374]|nr:MAG: hypothetical protein BWY66_00899 [bacterium ADurb.Bin374]